MEISKKLVRFYQNDYAKKKGGQGGQKLMRFVKSEYSGTCFDLLQLLEIPVVQGIATCLQLRHPLRRSANNKARSRLHRITCHRNRSVKNTLFRRLLIAVTQRDFTIWISFKEFTAEFTAFIAHRLT